MNSMHSGAVSAPPPNLEEERVSPAAARPQAATPHFTWREMAVFGSIVSMVLLAANALVCATWSFFFNLPGWIAWQALPGAPDEPSGNEESWPE
jgi:hypothetical protein